MCGFALEIDFSFSADSDSFGPFRIDERDAVFVGFAHDAFEFFYAVRIIFQVRAANQPGTFGNF